MNKLNKKPYHKTNAAIFPHSFFQRKDDERPHLDDIAHDVHQTWSLTSHLSQWPIGELAEIASTHDDLLLLHG